MGGYLAIKNAWFTLTVAFMVLFFSSGLRFAFGIVLKPMSEDLGWARAETTMAAYIIGSVNLSAPQATLMKSVAEGVFVGDLPWEMVQFGVILGLIIILLDIFQEKRCSSFRLPVLAVAVGIYLPIELTVPIFIGGMINHVGKKTGSSAAAEKKGLLLASGLITGEALMGILVAIPIFITGNKDWWPIYPGYDLLGIAAFLGVIYWLYNTVIKK